MFLVAERAGFFSKRRGPRASSFVEKDHLNPWKGKGGHKIVKLVSLYRRKGG